MSSDDRQARSAATKRVNRAIQTAREAATCDRGLEDIKLRRFHRAMDELEQVTGHDQPAAKRRIWRGVPAVHATVYRDDDGNEIVGSRGEWMLLAGESVCGPFRTFTEAKQYVEDNDV